MRRTKIFVTAASAILIGGGLIAGSTLTYPAARPDDQDSSQVERGRYLTTVADCQGCHTVPDGKQLFAVGRPIETPFGTLVSPNITPDRDTGIGAWSDDEFDAAVHEGRGRNGILLFPAMPYPA